MAISANQGRDTDHNSTKLVCDHPVPGGGDGAKNEGKKDFFVPAQPAKKKHRKNKQPGPDGSNAASWYGRFRGPISPLLVFNSVQLKLQSFPVWHFLTKIAPSSE